MNNPEYILTDEMGTVVTAVKTALSLSVLNYQYGPVDELNETLKQYEADPAKFNLKFPLVWLAEPFEILRGNAAYYGLGKFDLFIINSTVKTYKAAERMSNNYVPVLYPIYRQLLTELFKSRFAMVRYEEEIIHKLIKGYFWDKQRTVLFDAVDCLVMEQTQLRIKNNDNC